jgi:penicillin-binding protein 1C
VTTLDATTQARVQHLLDSRMQALMPLDVHHGAVIVVDNASGDVLAWVVAGGGAEGGPESHIDPVTTPRQPGSALKPLLYALALERGHTLADEILDAPLAEGVGDGLHRYRNYSDRHYGPVTLRDALANSLNIPAVKLLHAIGADRLLDHLDRLGIRSLREHPAVYGDGLALGNGEVTLFELVQAYHALANRGQMSALAVLRDAGRGMAAGERAISPETAALISHALSDPNARAAEFGRDSVLNLPVQTAIKTGTSSDYRDAWSVGFDSRYTVGIWMGNLDQTPTRGVTGSIGPALLLRSVFAWLNRDRDTRPLYLSPQLTRRTVCVPSPLAAPGDCIVRDEWFDPAHVTVAHAGQATGQPAETVDELVALKLRQPTPGLELAFDPRLPAASQAFRFLIDGADDGDRVEWLIDGEPSVADGADYLWPVSRGTHSVEARVHRDGILIAEVSSVEFRVR